jgi:hypothetical protein
MTSYGNVIIMAYPQIMLVSLLYMSKISAYCYHLGNVITLALSQSDQIKWLSQ